ncbi:MAG: hypothetical protein SFV15_02930 [Polyangiaceae bacterium]|nr:hypothetical protein [Polyangiaceae bacterium]
MPSDVVNQKPEVSEPTLPAKPPSGFKQTLKKLGLLLGALAIAYGAGRFQSARAWHATENAQAQTQKLEARRQLHLALMALEDRNFGTAQKTLTQAGAILRASQPSDEFSELAGEIENYKFVAGEDVSTDRQKVLGFTQRFDQLLSAAP